MIYYAIISEELFNSPIPEPIRHYMNYPEGTYLLKDCIFGYPKQTIDGLWLIDCRLRTWDYTEVWDNDKRIHESQGIANNDTARYLYKEEVAMWEQYLEQILLTDITEIEIIKDELPYPEI